MARIEDVVTAGDVHPLFQPIVDLATGGPVAVEAVTRGPQGPLHSPEALFAAAGAAGRLGDLDVLCRSRAVEAALAAGVVGPATPLFLNVEPGAADADVLSPTAFDAARRHGLRLVLELCERAVMDNPARLIAFADRARERGWGIALDDVGANPASLALMPFLRPDVVKLDLQLVARRPDEEVAQVMTAVNAYAEESGAVVLAEGVETAAHERTAVSLGATLAQGWHYGRPSASGDVRGGSPAPGLPLLLGAGGFRRPAPESPFDAVTRWRPSRRGTKDLLVEVTRLLERRATQMNGFAVVLATFQEAPNFTAATARRYADLVARTALVVALGADMLTEPLPGLRGADLRADDPVRGEWDVAVVGPHFAAALVARDLEVPGVPDADRPFDYVLTHDRALVMEVARSLMTRALHTGTGLRDDTRTPTDVAVGAGARDSDRGAALAGAGAIPRTT